MKLYDELKYRGLIKDISNPILEEKLNNESLTFYIGTDPTAPSMHIGHLSSFLISKRLKEHGHNPILLIGGATALIGDPKPSVERETSNYETIVNNAKSLTKQAKELFGFEVVNNYEWTKDINILEFLRSYGKYINVNYMLDKDTVRRRLETGITYTEFSYMLLQAMDFLYLYENKNCVLQVAGSDQWGNITTGIDLIRKKIGKEAYGFTMPLVTTKDGTKFGKTEGNALWLDKNMTSSYELYQFFLNVEDEMVISYLKRFTFLSKEEIDELEIKNNQAPHLREAHQALAKEVIVFLHGNEEYKKAVHISDMLFSGNIHELTKEEILVALKDVPTFSFNIDEDIVNVLVNNNICSSKREAREFINNGSITIKGNKISDESLKVDEKLLIDKELLVLRKGKKKYYIGKRSK